MDDQKRVRECSVCGAKLPWGEVWMHREIFCTDCYMRIFLSEKDGQPVLKYSGKVYDQAPVK